MAADYSNYLTAGGMSPEEYARQQRMRLLLENAGGGQAPGAAPGSSVTDAIGAATEPAAFLGPVGQAVSIGGQVLKTAGDVVGASQAEDMRKKNLRKEEQRQSMIDSIAAQDRRDQRLQTQINNQANVGRTAGDFMDNIYNKYRSYTGGYFSSHA